MLNDCSTKQAKFATNFTTNGRKLTSWVRRSKNDLGAYLSIHSFLELADDWIVGTDALP